MLNRLRWMQATYRLTPTIAVLQKTPFSFDVSVWEFFWPLHDRRTLAIAAPRRPSRPERLAELMRASA